VKYLLELLHYTYNELKDKGEIAIIEKYWAIAKYNTKIFTRKKTFFNLSIKKNMYTFCSFFFKLFLSNALMRHIYLWI